MRRPRVTPPAPSLARLDELCRPGVTPPAPYLVWLDERPPGAGDMLGVDANPSHPPLEEAAAPSPEGCPRSLVMHLEINYQPCRTMPDPAILMSGVTSLLWP